MRTTTIHALFIAAALGGGLAIGYLFLPGEWYQSLVKPVFTPPNWLFAPAWSILYVLIGIAGARTFIRERASPPMALWVSQMVLNFLWSPVFFGAQRPALGLGIIILLLISILLFIIRRWRLDRVSALLFVPYALWVSFATLLNASIVYLN